jgi:hypothetical protein
MHIAPRVESTMSTPHREKELLMDKTASPDCGASGNGHPAGSVDPVWHERFILRRNGRVRRSSERAYWTRDDRGRMYVASASGGQTHGGNDEGALEERLGAGDSSAHFLSPQKVDRRILG